MDWDCPICGLERDPFETPQALAGHMVDTHTEWLDSRQVPWWV